MTFREFVKQYLESNGMFESQADSVVQAVIENDDVMNERWNDDVKDYPEVMKGVILIGVDHWATEYIKENCPKAWFRPIFDTEYAEEVGIKL